MTRPNLMTIATRAFGTPLFLDPAKADIFANMVAPRIYGLDGGAGVEVSGATFDTDLHDAAMRPSMASLLGDEVHAGIVGTRKAYTNYGGVAVIPVVGTMVRRGSWVGAESGTTSYEGVSAQLRAAVADPDVKVIALEIDSFGGEAAGMFDLCTQIREVREIKPVHAFIADYALSAGYGIASQADTITVPPFGSGGSVGVVMMHVDQSAFLKKEGLKITLIHSGAHKVEGNPFEALPEKVKAHYQKDADVMWASFADHVSEGRRGQISAADVLKTQAAVLRGEALVSARLADRVEEARVAFQDLVDEVNKDGAVVPPEKTKDQNANASAEDLQADDQSGSGCTIGVS